MEQTIVKGRLKKNLEYWKNIGCNETVLKVIREVYRIPFLTTLPGTILRNNRSALEYKGFVSRAISELLHTGSIKEVNCCESRVS